MLKPVAWKVREGTVSYEVHSLVEGSVEESVGNEMFEFICWIRGV